jgi:flagellar FliL protein
MASAAKAAKQSREEEAAPPSAAAPKRGRGGLLAIFGAAVVAAGLASGATWMLLPKAAPHPAHKAAKSSADAATDSSKDAAGDAPGDGAAADSDSAGEQPAMYLELTPAFVVNLSDEESMRFLQISVEVMARDSKVIDAVKTHTPRIRNALMLLFSQQSSHTIAGREAKEALQKQALDEVQKALKAENAPADVAAVYFTSLVMQ